MKIKYIDVSEPDKVKVYDSDLSYENNMIQSRRGISADEWAAEGLGRFEKDKENGVILDFEVIDDATADTLRKQEELAFFKEKLHPGSSGRFRFNSLEFFCSYTDVDAADLAVALMGEGYGIDFVDASISCEENARKELLVKQRFAESIKVGSVDALIGDASERSGNAKAADNNKSKDDCLIEH